MKNVRIKIYTLGCKVNQYDSGKLASGLVQAGFILTNKNAGITIVNSCAVTKTAMVKSARMIKLAKKGNPNAKIILTGCWPKVYDIKNIGVDFVVKTGDVRSLVKRISSQYREQPEFAAPLINSGIAMTDRTRYFIKIQDGCEQYCSYCIIPYTRGKLKSRGEKEIICEIQKAVKTGYREIILSGIHLGLYGYSVIAGLTRNPGRRAVKINSGSHLRGGNCINLVSLLKKLSKIKNLGRIRLSSIEITEVSDELVNLIAESNKICRHLHIPLQSGSDKILKLMNRPYDVKYFKNRIAKIKSKMPDIAISTDIIVGFPGESVKDFKDTEKLIKEIKFSRLHVFPFSAHEKTPAAKFPAQVEEKTLAQRAKTLRRLGVKLVEDYKNKFKGRELEIVVEQIKQDKIIGKTEFYFDIKTAKNQIKHGNNSIKNNLIGKIVKIKN